MNIIIDECVPHIIKKRLPHCQIKTVQEMGWAGTKNGELLKLIESDFDVFIRKIARRLQPYLAQANWVERSAFESISA
jgi:hypothetical protein